MAEFHNFAGFTLEKNHHSAPNLSRWDSHKIISVSTKSYLYRCLELNVFTTDN